MQVLTELRIENVTSTALNVIQYCDVWKQLIQLDKTRKERIVITAREREASTRRGTISAVPAVLTVTGNCHVEERDLRFLSQIEQEITELNNVCFVKSEMNSKSVGNF